MYTLFDHTADLGLRVEAPDLDTLFREAAEGLFAMIVDGVPSGGAVELLEFFEVRIEESRRDLLLFDWLAELLYTYEARRVLLGEFDVRVDAAGLTGRARVVPFDAGQLVPLREVKAITYHGLHVERTDNGWAAEVIVDI